ncbi:putative aminotransferase [Apodospora peruviana]|uniref:Aminotransferase n=1 Tax=Apodospora peruviana TaxID=516989 RepID=A0AAE0M2Q5_9PEZI|nr:putative aminotransferase [Apodospora peruviana]
MEDNNSDNNTSDNNENPGPEFDIEQVRKQFSALDDTRQIPLNNAAGSLVYQGAIDSLSSDSEIIVSVLYHEASITACVALAKSLNYDHKMLDFEALRGLLTPKTRVVCYSHVNNVLGTIHPVRAVADLVRSIPGALLCVDGVACAPHRPIDVNALDVDFYTISWYKAFGSHYAQLYGRRSAHQRRLDVKLGLGMNCFELEGRLVPIVRYLSRLGFRENVARHEADISLPLLEYLCSSNGEQLYTLYGEKTADPTKRVSCISFAVNGHPERRDRVRDPRHVGLSHGLRQLPLPPDRSRRAWSRSGRHYSLQFGPL